MDGGKPKEKNKISTLAHATWGGLERARVSRIFSFKCMCRFFLSSTHLYVVNVDIILKSATLRSIKRTWKFMVVFLTGLDLYIYPNNLS